MQDSLYTDRCEKERRGDAFSKQLDRNVTNADVVKCSLPDANPVECFSIGAHGVAAACCSGNVPIRFFRKSFARAGFPLVEREREIDSLPGHSGAVDLELNLLSD